MQYHSDGTGRDSYIGFNKGGLAVYGSKTIQGGEAFRRSLRQHSRPQSAYIKSGGFQTGMSKSASVTLLPGRPGDCSRRQDILRDRQMTFNKQFCE